MQYVISDYDLHVICYDTCVEDTSQCILSCDPSDSECVHVCLRAEADCIRGKTLGFFLGLGLSIVVKNHLGCPCDTDCPNGCDGCANSICECSVTSTTSVSTTTSKSAAKEAVLMLSTAYSTNVPMVIGYNGNHLQVFLILY